MFSRWSSASAAGLAAMSVNSKRVDDGIEGGVRQTIVNEQAQRAPGLDATARLFGTLTRNSIGR